MGETVQNCRSVLSAIRFFIGYRLTGASFMRSLTIEALTNTNWHACFGIASKRPFLLSMYCCMLVYAHNNCETRSREKIFLEHVTLEETLIDVIVSGIPIILSTGSANAKGSIHFGWQNARSALRVKACLDYADIVMVAPQKTNSMLVE